jgi:hypothetical protein
MYGRFNTNMTDASMFDPPEDAETSDDVSAEVEGDETTDMATVRVIGLPYVSSYTYEGVEITRTGTEVPILIVEELLLSARRNNVKLEVVSE